MIQDPESTAEDVATENADDKNNGLLNVISFFIPVIGGILYLVNKDDCPIKARGIGRSALMGVVYGLVYLIMKSMLYSS